uniref:Ovule protein n=1 Tax=Ascaris lumbricoides TaxID=6252 RepID=A0A0M3HIR2_ASCLU
LVVQLQLLDLTKIRDHDPNRPLSLQVAPLLLVIDHCSIMLHDTEFLECEQLQLFVIPYLLYISYVHSNPLPYNMDHREFVMLISVFSLKS